MRMRKRKWVGEFLSQENNYLIDNAFNYDNLYLEIGSGMGDFITESACVNKDRLYIAIEKDETCVARTIKKANELKLTNFKILKKDANEINEYINKDSVKELYLFFSDPWPKKRHHKRRLTYPTFLNVFYELLKKDGKLLIKTDNDDLYLDSLEYVKLSKFKLIYFSSNYNSLEHNIPISQYEKRFISLGKNINYIELIK